MLTASAPCGRHIAAAAACRRAVRLLGRRRWRGARRASDNGLALTALLLLQLRLALALLPRDLVQPRLALLLLAQLPLSLLPLFSLLLLHTPQNTSNPQHQIRQILALSPTATTQSSLYTAVLRITSMYTDCACQLCRSDMMTSCAELAPGGMLTLRRRSSSCSRQRATYSCRRAIWRSYLRLCRFSSMRLARSACSHAVAHSDPCCPCACGCCVWLPLAYNAVACGAAKMLFYHGICVRMHKDRCIHTTWA